VYLDLDEAWEPNILALPRRDARAWGPRLRCFAPRQTMETFIRDVTRNLPPFVLYGSGDYHHLAAALLRNIPSPALTLIMFDNHPDWDIRPPRWACGGWVNRALELANVRRAIVWGCGNFELNWPTRLFGNRRLEVRAWAERYPGLGGITRNNWRSQFEEFAASLSDQDVYVTVDMDCLRQEEAVTNWENGLFSADDVAWAIGCLRSRVNVIGGDVCGAYSPPVYERRLQRLAAEWDRPKRLPQDLARARAINTASLKPIWSALVGSSGFSSPPPA
jgi:arginase family enzyme